MMPTEQDATSRWSDQGRFHDIVEGRRFVKALNVRDIALANELLRQLAAFDGPNRTGRLFFGLNYALGLGDATRRMPEISFVSHERWPARKRLPTEEPWQVAPDLVAEIVTPSCSAATIERKVDEYRRAGVRLIWEVFTETEQIVVHGKEPAPVTLSRDDTLDGGDVFPGFGLPLARLFDL